MSRQKDREDLLCYLVDDIKEVKQDVKNLLKFKWQVMAGAGALGFLFSAILSIITLATK